MLLCELNGWTPVTHLEQYLILNMLVQVRYDNLVYSSHQPADKWYNPTFQIKKLRIILRVAMSLVQDSEFLSQYFHSYSMKPKLIILHYCGASEHKMPLLGRSGI